MKKTWRHYVNGDYHDFKNFGIYWAWREWNRNEIKRKDFEESFTGQFLKAGFIPSMKIDPCNNWFGVSVYEPDLRLIKGHKIVYLSLQGMQMPLPPKEDEGAWELIKTCNCKYIGIFENNKKLYEDWTGNLPPKELINQFI